MSDVRLIVMKALNGRVRVEGWGISHASYYGEQETMILKSYKRQQVAFLKYLLTFSKWLRLASCFFRKVL
jgi:hypothetical protein